jgi:hypothetical protein
MKSKTRAALALTAVLGLAACWGEDDNKNENTTTATQTTEASTDETVSLTERYAFTATIPVTRNEKDFTVDVRTACMDIAKDDNYEAACLEETTTIIQEKFMCSGFALAAGATRTNSQEILERGLTGRYDEFPSQYLSTDEEFEDALATNRTNFRSKAVTVITGVSDLDAAAFTDPEGTHTRDLCPDFP